MSALGNIRCLLLRFHSIFSTSIEEPTNLTSCLLRCVKAIGSGTEENCAYPLMMLLGLCAGLAGAMPAAAQTAHVGAATTVVASDPVAEFSPEGLAIDPAGNVYNGNDAGIGLDESTYSNGSYATKSMGLLATDDYSV
jgi:hypothetical protein